MYPMFTIWQRMSVSYCKMDMRAYHIHDHCCQMLQKWHASIADRLNLCRRYGLDILNYQLIKQQHALVYFTYYIYTMFCRSWKTLWLPPVNLVSFMCRWDLRLKSPKCQNIFAVCSLRHSHNCRIVSFGNGKMAYRNWEIYHQMWKLADGFHNKIFLVRMKDHKFDNLTDFTSFNWPIRFI